MLEITEIRASTEPGIAFGIDCGVEAKRTAAEERRGA
jgi:hypothetical protein